MADFAVAISKNGEIPDRVRKRLPPGWHVQKDWGGTILATRQDLKARVKLAELGDAIIGQISFATYRSSSSIQEFWTTLEAKHVSEADVLDESVLQLCLDLNGHFSLCLVADGRFVAITDRGGTVPVYYTHHEDVFCAATNPNVVALLSGRNRPDPVSINDFLAYGYVCHPYSWFVDIKAVNPASGLIYSRGHSEPRTAYYWWPGKDQPINDLSDAAGVLRTTLQRIVEASTAGLSRAAVLYSGGKDSRIVASLIPDTCTKQGYVFLQEKNREYLLAASSARLLGMPLAMLCRGPDHYIMDLESKQDLVGFGCDLFHTHAYGLHDQIVEPVVLGGYGADACLKGGYARGPSAIVRVPRQELLGPYRQEVAARRERRSDWLSSLAPSTHREWHAIWPLCGLRAFSQFALSRRLLPVREPFIYSDLVGLAAQIRTDDKLGGELFYLAFRDVLGLSGLVPTSSKQIPAFGTRQNHLLHPFVALAFGLLGLIMYRPAGQGAWAGRKRFLASAKFRDILHRYADVWSEFDGGSFDRWRHEIAASMRGGQASMSLRLLQAAAAIAKTSA